MATRMQQIGRYEVERELGRGAMGVVYLARDTRIGRSVALKTIRLSDFADAEKLQRLRERLVREAQSAGILSHENIVTIYDVDEQNGLSYISMEYVEGDSLEHMLEKRRELSREMLLSLLRQMAEALDFAHSRGIVHRDIKPPNIMVTPTGRVRITDFGIAKIAHASSVTQGGGMLGTPDYMSPEQIAGSAIDGRSDQFSLGVIAFELLSGEKPFVAETLPALFYRIAHQPSPDATLLNRSLSPAIGKVLERAMAKEAADRFPSCLTFVDALAEACATSPGWHALPRGMSQTLPTMGDAAQTAPKPAGDSVRQGQSPPLSPSAPKPPPVAPSPAARPAEEPVWVPTLPPPRVEATPSRPIPATEVPHGGAGGGFITGGDPSQSETLEISGPPQPSWLRDVHEEEKRQKQSRRRAMLVALLSFLVVAGALAAVYFGVGGVDVPGITRQPAQLAADGSGDGRPSSTEGDTTPDGVTPPPETLAPAEGSAEPQAGEGTPIPETPTPETPGTDSRPPVETPQPAPEVPKPTPPESAKPKGPERPGTRTASVRFISEPPGAEVTVDAESRFRCQTPCSLELPLGRHTYSVRLTGYRNEIKLIDLAEAGETVSVKLERRVGMVRVTSTPTGASVFVNGERQQAVTPTTLRLLPGTYRLSIEKDGRRIERNVNVSEDSAVQIDAALQ